MKKILTLSKISTSLGIQKMIEEQKQESNGIDNVIEGYKNNLVNTQTKPKKTPKENGAVPSEPESSGSLKSEASSGQTLKVDPATMVALIKRVDTIVNSTNITFGSKQELVD